MQIDKARSGHHGWPDQTWCTLLPPPCCLPAINERDALTLHFCLMYSEEANGSDRAVPTEAGGLPVPQPLLFTPQTRPGGCWGGGGTDPICREDSPPADIKAGSWRLCNCSMSRSQSSKAFWDKCSVLGCSICRKEQRPRLVTTEQNRCNWLLAADGRRGRCSQLLWGQASRFWRLVTCFGWYWNCQRINIWP